MPSASRWPRSLRWAAPHRGCTHPSRSSIAAPNGIRPRRPNDAIGKAGFGPPGVGSTYKRIQRASGPQVVGDLEHQGTPSAPRSPAPACPRTAHPQSSSRSCNSQSERRNRPDAASRPVAACTSWLHPPQAGPGTICVHDVAGDRRKRSGITGHVREPPAERRHHAGGRGQWSECQAARRAAKRGGQPHSVVHPRIGPARASRQPPRSAPAGPPNPS